MREIKFRAWDKVAKQIIFINSFDDCTWNEILEAYKDTMMEFTGLKDKNGKEIYEGDIIIVDGKRCKTIFNLGEFTFQTEVDENAYYCIGYHSDCKVIGNIYKNPELLEKSNE